MSLVLLVALPFLASLLAALLPANARNAESTLAGVIALLCALLTALSFPDIAGGGVLTSLLYSALAACSAMVLSQRLCISTK